jgi:hypothetical protein
MSKSILVPVHVTGTQAVAMRNLLNTIHEMDEVERSIFCENLDGLVREVFINTRQSFVPLCDAIIQIVKNPIFDRFMANKCEEHLADHREDNKDWYTEHYSPKKEQLQTEML